jgi:hypothetical protein
MNTGKAVIWNETDQTKSLFTILIKDDRQPFQKHDAWPRPKLLQQRIKGLFLKFLVYDLVESDNGISYCHRTEIQQAVVEKNEVDPQ